MKDWNVIISVYQGGYRRALRFLTAFGQVERSPYHNVLVMSVADPAALLTAVEQRTEESPALYDAISRVAPAMRTFEFHSVEEFKEKAVAILLEWAPRLTGRTFHVRLHRRGDKRELSTQDVERFLDDALLDATAAALPGKISFTDPDAVIAIDTIDDRAGMALWTRDDLARHHLVRPD